MEVRDQLHDPAAFPRGLDAVEKRKNFPLPGIKLRPFSQ
jgi:hypothetical protein